MNPLTLQSVLNKLPDSKRVGDEVHWKGVCVAYMICRDMLLIRIPTKVGYRLQPVGYELALDEALKELKARNS